MPKRTLKILLFAAVAMGACSKHATPTSGHRLGAVKPPPGRVIGFDPSVVGLPGAIVYAVQEPFYNTPSPGITVGPMTRPDSVGAHPNDGGMCFLTKTIASFVSIQ